MPNTTKLLKQTIKKTSVSLQGESNKVTSNFDHKNRFISSYHLHISINYHTNHLGIKLQKLYNQMKQYEIVPQQKYTQTSMLISKKEK